MRISLLLIVSLLAVAPTTSAKDSAGQVETVLTETFSGFTLQVAAFNTRADAERIAKQLPKSWIYEASVQGRVVYRVNFGRFSSRSQALAGQWDLEDIIASLPPRTVASSGLVVKYQA